MNPKILVACTAIAAAVLLATSSCATNRPPEYVYKSQSYRNADKAAKAGQDPGKIMVCEESTVTGSHIPTRRCWTKLELDAAKERAQQAAESQRIEEQQPGR